MAEAKKKDEDLDLKEDEQEEEAVVVEGDETPKKKDDKEEERKVRTPGKEDDEPEEEEPPEATPAEREAIRERRREERKARKEYQRQRDIQFEFLKQRNQELEGRIGAVENRNFGADIARIDHALAESESQIVQARGLIEKAASENNGKAMAEAQDALYQARRRNEDLAQLKQSIAANQRRPNPIDPRMANHAKDWMSKNTWFDPRGRDEDSRITLTLDTTLSEEGWNSTTPEYWMELSNRLKKYMPHRFREADPQQRQERQTTTGTDRESAPGTRVTYTLNGERVKALKEAGMWEQFQSDPKFKAKMIARYKEADSKEKR